MTEPPESNDEKQVFCRRNQRLKTLNEHDVCPYCFGQKKEIADGWHPDFCSFDPEKDPINFGFPPDSSRNEHG